MPPASHSLARTGASLVFNGNCSARFSASMAVLLCRDRYISVLLAPDKSGNSSYIPIVEIRHKRDNNPAARLVSTGAFLRFTEARIHGLDMGKKWIDEQTPKPKSAVATGETRKRCKAEIPRSFSALSFESRFSSMNLSICFHT